MLPVFWIDALMLACGGWLMHSDAGKTVNSKQYAVGRRPVSVSSKQ